jgi:hypothetical protein
MTLMQNLTDRFEEFSTKLNYNLTTTTGDGDIDIYLLNIAVLAAKTDGFITNPDPATSERIVEVLNETGAKYMIMLNSVRDETAMPFCRARRLMALPPARRKSSGCTTIIRPTGATSTPPKSALSTSTGRRTWTLPRGTKAFCRSLTNCCPATAP